MNDDANSHEKAVSVEDYSQTDLAGKRPIKWGRQEYLTVKQFFYPILDTSLIAGLIVWKYLKDIHIQTYPLKSCFENNSNTSPPCHTYKSLY